MKKSFGFLFVVTLISAVLTCGVLNGCKKQPEQREKPVDSTLINGLETIDDLYALTAIEITPDDEYGLSLNTDKKYVSEGAASLSYSFGGGGSHLFCQYIANGKLPDLDVRKLKSVSLDFYNASDREQKVTLSVTTKSGAALFSKQQVIAANAKTTVKYDELATFSYKKKENVGGFSFRFDVEEAVKIYVDNMRVELGAEDIPTIGFDEFIESVANVPTEQITPETFDENVAFVDAVYYAEQLYCALANKNSVKAENVAKLNRYRELVGGFGAVYSPRNDTDILDKWEYGAGLTVGSDIDETYGAIWSVAVNAKRGEQSFKFVNLDTLGFGQVVMYVYNPTDSEMSYRISSGWQHFSAKVGTMQPKQWTKIVCNAKFIEEDISGSLFLTIYRMSGGVRQPFEGVFGFTAVYGEPARFEAQKVIDMINELPDESKVEVAHRTIVNNILAAYDELSKSARNTVENYKKLENAANKIVRLQSEAVDERIAELVANAVSNDNAVTLYEETLRLYADIESLDADVYDAITNFDQLERFKRSFDSYLPDSVARLIDGLPDSQNADFPKAFAKLQQITQIVDLLGEEEVSAEHMAKLEADKAASNNYSLLDDFGNDGISKISTDTDFGNAWKGELSIQTDYEYGKLMVCDVKSGHSGDYSRNAEFRIRAASVAVTSYEKIVFYVYCPIEGALFRCYPSNWRNPVDISLKANAWNKIETDASLFVDGNLDGMFFLFIAPQGKQPVGVWKVSSVYGYGDTQTAQQAAARFVNVVKALPDTDELTLNNKAAVDNATVLYDSLTPYSRNFVGSDVMAKYNAAVSKMELLEQSALVVAVTDKINALTDSSDGKAVFEALYAYTSLDKALQSLVGSPELNKLMQAVESNRLFPAAFDREVALFAESYDFPRDKDKVKVLCDIVDGLSDDVYALLSAETSEILTDINKIAKKYSVVVRVSGEIVTDETYGNVFEITPTSETGSESLFLKLNKGVASGKNIVFYIYRPSGATDAFLYFAGQNNSWTANENTSVTINADGWTRIEFSAEYILNENWDTYWYLYLKNETTEEQQGWLISEIYAYTA